MIRILSVSIFCCQAWSTLCVWSVEPLFRAKMRCQPRLFGHGLQAGIQIRGFVEGIQQQGMGARVFVTRGHCFF